MGITKRQGEILNRIVQEYIELAQPVSSKLLKKKYDFEIRPAMIRIEMQKLTDKGYLLQPHTSAGRVPTDKGYRFFVDNILKRGFPEFKEISKIEEILKKEQEDILAFASQMTKFLVKISSSFTVFHLLEKDLFWKEGWKEILREPEFSDRDLISNFVKFLEDFERDIKNLKINSKIKIFIGKENPFSRAKDFSIISSKGCFPDAGEGIVSFLGPKRMAYDKNIGLINSLMKILEKY